MKLRLGADFIDILHEAYMLTDPKCAKNTVEPLVFFALLGPMRIKAAHFTGAFFVQKCFGFVIFGAKISAQNACIKCL